MILDPANSLPSTDKVRDIAILPPKRADPDAESAPPTDTSDDTALKPATFIDESVLIVSADEIEPPKIPEPLSDNEFSSRRQPLAETSVPPITTSPATERPERITTSALNETDRSTQALSETLKDPRKTVDPVNEAVPPSLRSSPAERCLPIRKVAETDADDPEAASPRIEQLPPIKSDIKELTVFPAMIPCCEKRLPDAIRSPASEMGPTDLQLSLDPMETLPWK